MSEGRQLLAAAEAVDGYRAACEASELNRMARRGQVYEPFFVDSDTAEYLEEVSTQTPLLRQAQIIVLHPSADNGYPHTRPGGLICMPAQACKRNPVCEETLLHEAVHLHQRLHSESWNAACMRDKWRPIETERIPFRFRQRCRINPDTMATPFWAWEGIHVPLPLYYRDDSPRLSDVQMKWFDLRNGAVYSSPPPSFQARYGDAPPQPEHPYELLAVEFSAAGLRSEEEVEQRLRGL